MRDILYIGNKLEKHGASPTSTDILPEHFNKLGLTTIAFSSKKNKIFRFIDITWSLLKYARNSRFVIIDTYSTLNFWFAVWSGFICFIMNAKYIPLLRGGNLIKRLNHNSTISNFYFSHSYTNIAPSFYFHNLFESFGIKNLKYIPNSLYIRNYPFKSRGDLKPKLLWVRAFAEIYRPSLALEVIEILLEEYPDLQLCMVGPEKDGSLERLQNMARQRNLPVTFTGKLSKSEWTELAQEYDIFLNTTSIDNTPVSVIEAMALGLPVISTNVGGIPYLIQNGQDGLLVEPEDPKAMANAIRKLLEGPELASKLSMNARKKVENYDWEKVKHIWLELLG